MFLSMIIPVYNTEKFLADCLDSCLRQDLSSDEYEIICVNDGSTDNSLAILEEYSRRYENIRIISQENGGVSKARNAGINAARGDYLWFIDSDDFIMENCIAQLREIAEREKCDELSFEHYELENALSPEELKNKAAGLLHANTTGCGYLITDALFRRSVLTQSGIRFREGIAYAEDGLFSYEFSAQKPSGYKFYRVLYYYRRNNSSATRAHDRYSRQKYIESAYRVAVVMMEYAVKNKAQFSDLHSDEAIACLMPNVRTITISAASLPRGYRREILKQLREHRLFPLFLYRTPRQWFPQKIHMNMAYKGIKGKIFDILNFYSTTRLGFFLLTLCKRLRA